MATLTPGVDEPLFNVRRLSLPAAAAVSSISAHSRYLVVGTYAGSLHILDYGGTERRRLTPHSASVNSVCVDDTGAFIASAADDCAIIVSRVSSRAGGGGIEADEATDILDDITDPGSSTSGQIGGASASLASAVSAGSAGTIARDDGSFSARSHRPTLCVSLGGDYATSRDRPLVTGGVSGRVRAYRKAGLLGAIVDEKLHDDDGEGPVRALAWAPNGLLAWANDAGVKVIDPSRRDLAAKKDSGEKIAFVPAPSGALPLEACPPRLVWEAPRAGAAATGAVAAAGAIALLHIAWGDTIRTIAIKERDRIQSVAPGILPALSLPPTQTPMLASALAPSVSGTPIVAGAVMLESIHSGGASPILSIQVPQPEAIGATPLPSSANPAGKGGFGSFRTAFSGLGGLARALSNSAEAAVATAAATAANAVGTAATAVALAGATAAAAAVQAGQNISDVSATMGVRVGGGSTSSSLTSSIPATPLMMNAQTPSFPLLAVPVEAPRPRFWESSLRASLGERALVCGVAPFGESHLALLLFSVVDAPAGSDSRSEGKAADNSADDRARIELRIISRDGAVFSSCPALVRVAIPFRDGGNPLLPCDIHLAVGGRAVANVGIAGGGLDSLPDLVVAAPRDVLVVAPRSIGERASWLASHGRTREAIAAAISVRGALPQLELVALITNHVNNARGARSAAEAMRFFPALPSGRIRDDAWDSLTQRLLAEGGDAPLACMSSLALPNGRPRSWAPPARANAALAAAAAEADAEGYAPPSTVALHRAYVQLAPATYDAILRVLIKGCDGVERTDEEVAEDAEVFLDAVRCWWRPHESGTISVAEGAAARDSLAPEGSGAPSSNNNNFSETVASVAALATAPSALFAQAFSFARKKAAGGGAGRGDDARSAPGSAASSLNASFSTPVLSLLAAAENDTDASGAAASDSDRGLTETEAAGAANPAQGKAEAQAQAASICTIFTLPDTIAAVETHVRGLKSLSPTPRALAPFVDALAELRLLEGDASAALKVYLDASSFVRAANSAEAPGGGSIARTAYCPRGLPLGVTAALALASRFALWPDVLPRIRDFWSLDPQAVCTTFARGLPGAGGPKDGNLVGAFPLDVVMQALDDSPPDLCSYLVELSVSRREAFEQPPPQAAKATAAAHALLLKLLPVHKPDALLVYLQTSGAYPLLAAKELFQRAEPPMWRELAIVTARTGDARGALDIYLSRLGDVKAAIELVGASDGGDGALWPVLLAATVRAAEAAGGKAGGALVGALLDALPDTPLSVARVLDEIPPGIVVPDGTGRLVALVRDAGASRARTELTAGLVRDDVMRLSARLAALRARALRIDSAQSRDGHPCALCLARVDVPRASGESSAPLGDADVDTGAAAPAAAPAALPPAARFFSCSHAFHDTCLAAFGVGRGAAHAASLGRALSPAPLGARSRVSSSASLVGLTAPPTAGAGAMAASGWRGGTLLVGSAARSTRSSFDDMGSGAANRASFSAQGTVPARRDSSNNLYDAVDAALDSIGLSEEATLEEKERLLLRREARIVASLRCPLCRAAA